MVDIERRRSARTPAALAIGIDGETRKQRFGVARDASDTGMLIATPSHFEIGDELELTVFFDVDDKELVHARVIRVEKTPLQSNEPWRYRLALAFDEPWPDLKERCADRH